MLRTAACVATLVLTACSSPIPAIRSAIPFIQTAEPTASAVEENRLRTTLPNGLKVVLVEDHSAPVVALNVWVRVGSADERPDEAGMAHVFEHMLFKGTERRPVGEIARTVEAAGGMINAFTSFDMTVYHITMSSRDVATGIDVLSDSVQFSTFDPDELAKETEVVVEEINRGEDSPGRVLSQKVFDVAYQQHPYGVPVIGTEASVRSFTRDQMLAFHKRWYVPNNMTFVAVGDFDKEDVLAQIERAFATAKPRPDLAHPRAAESPQREPRAYIERREFSQTLLGIAYPITSFRHEDTAFLDLLSGVLGGGESSRLYRAVKDEQKLVHTISTGAYTPLDPGLFFIDAALDPENVEAALSAIEEEVARLIRFGPTQTELERARVNLLSQEIHEKETMEGQARKHGYYEALADGIELEEQYLRRIRLATAEDVRRVAEEYLDGARANVVALLPEDKRAELAPDALVAAIQAEAPTTGTIASEELREDIRRYTLPNGLRLVVKRNPAVPLVSMRIAFLGGLLAEDEGTQGLSSFLGEMLEKGTESRSAAQLAAEVESLAGSLAGFSGRNTFGLTGEFLTESLVQGLDLFTDALLRPAFAPDEIDKLRAETLAAIQRREDNLAQKAFEIFAQEVHDGHPYRFPTLGREKSVQDFDQATLRAFWERYAQPANGVLAVVGDVDPDEVASALALRLADWKGPASVDLPARTQPAAPAEPREVALEKGRQQVHIVVGFPGLALDDPDEAPLEVLTQLLSGQGGRLFVELRDKRSLAYSVTAFSIEGVDPGSWGVYIASAPEKLEESRDGLVRELARLLDEPIAPAELDRAKAYLMGSHDVSLQRYSSQASLLALEELYGLGATHHLDYADRVQAVTADDVKRVAQRIIRLEAPLVAIVK